MIRHLSRFRLITVRESRSFHYLQRLGLANMIQTADPAFLMKPEPATALDLPERFIGLNLSPLTARSLPTQDIVEWVRICGAAVKAILRACDLPVVLFPHVIIHTPINDDYAFLEKVAHEVNGGDRIYLVRPDLAAAQVKWAIGKSIVFAGARTHATIAAMSMGVPTISLAYSVKAWGINEDLFGHTQFCIDSKELCHDETLAKGLVELLHHSEQVRHHLGQTLPKTRQAAMNAGIALRTAICGVRAKGDSGRQ